MLGRGGGTIVHAREEPNVKKLSILTKESSLVATIDASGYMANWLIRDAGGLFGQIPCAPARHDHVNDFEALFLG